MGICNEVVKQGEYYGKNKTRNRDLTGKGVCRGFAERAKQRERKIRKKEVLPAVNPRSFRERSKFIMIRLDAVNFEAAK